MGQPHAERGGPLALLVPASVSVLGDFFVCLFGKAEPTSYFCLLLILLHPFT